MHRSRTRLISAALILLATLLAPVQRIARAQGPDPFLSLLAHEVDPKSCAIGTLVPDMPLLGFDGKGPSLSESIKDRKAMVLCLTSATCPLSSRYGPRLSSIATEYLPKGVGFALVNVSDTDTEPEMRQQSKELRWAGLYVPDAERAVRRAITPRTTSEVLVIDAGRTLVYRGAVDDQFGVGSALADAKRTFLRDALDAVLAGRPVPIPATWSPGCSVDPPEKGVAVATDVTYHNRISRIIRERCESCHFNGGPAPFSLETHRAVSGRSSMIAAVVRTGLMPPWDARPPTGEGDKSLAWKHDPTLTDEERRDLLVWLDGARSEGDINDAPAPVTRHAGWQMGSPDGVLLSPRVDLPTDGPLVYARLEIDTMLREPAWVSSWELMARKRMALHHAVMFLERERLPEGMSDDTALREGRLEPLLAAGAAHSAAACPPDSARAIPAGSRLIVHAWFRPMGKITGERLRVAFKLMREVPANVVRSIPVWTDAPGPLGTAWTAQSVVAEPSSLVAVTPAISLAAKDVKLTLQAVPEAGDDEERTLFSAGRFRALWPTRYEPLEPFSLAPSGVLKWTATPTEEPAAGGALQGLSGFMGFVEVMMKRE